MDVDVGLCAITRREDGLYDVQIDATLAKEYARQQQRATVWLMKANANCDFLELLACSSARMSTKEFADLLTALDGSQVETLQRLLWLVTTGILIQFKKHMDHEIAKADN